MRVVLYMAQSVNGMIARENYDEDFLSHKNWEVFVKLAEEMGCFIVGRKTYDEVGKWQEYNFDSVRATKIIVSRNVRKKLAQGYVLASSPEDALKKASEQGHTSVLVTGGGTVNSAFMKAGLVDEVILNIEPFVLGKGIRIFSESLFECELQFAGVKKFGGIVQLQYVVKKLRTNTN